MSSSSQTTKFKIVRDCSNSSVTETIVGGIAVGFFVVVWASSLASPVLLVLSLATKNYILAGIILALATAAYVPWQKGRLSRLFQDFFETYHPKYYKSCKILFHPNALPEEEEEGTNIKTRRKFYAIHPHALYWSPFFHLVCRLAGNPGKADKLSMHTYMKEGSKDLALPPGGFEEATITCNKQDRVYIKHRTGFVKLCLQYGYSIVPVYCFGEKSTFWNLQGGWNFRLKVLNKWGIPGVVAWGLPWWVGPPLVPNRNITLLVVGGEPLLCPKIENPTKEDVKKWHDKYMAALQRLFEEHKVEAYGEEVAKTAKLEMW